MVQKVETGLDISATGALFTLDIAAADLLDVYIDGQAAADYEVRAGPNESTIYPSAVVSLTGGTDYASAGNRLAAHAIEVRVTTAAGAGDTADVYVATRD